MTHLSPCSGCTEYKPDRTMSLCPVNGHDGLVVRCAGRWTEEKTKCVGYYLGCFTSSMKQKGPKKNYIDLMSGPGICRVRRSGQEVEGSPIVALRVKFPFSHYYFNDRDPQCLEALKTRAGALQAPVTCHFFEEDCNDAIGRITQQIGSKELSVAFIDLTGAQLHFESLAKLAEGRKMDLIITFPLQMALKRVVPQALRAVKHSLDAFFPDRNWRKVVKQAQVSGRPFGPALLDYYKTEGLAKLGYKTLRMGQDVLISTAKKGPLYYLLFASKHDLGITFWGRVRRQAEQQLELALVTSTL